MRRRDVIGALAAGAVARPIAAAAQQSAGRPARIGFLGATSGSGYASQLAGLRDGLRDLGYVEGVNLAIDFRWAEGRYDRLPALAAELVRSNPDLIVTHGTPASRAAKGATTTVPIVMAIVGDPVTSGIVVSLARPGGNITGQSFFSPELRVKRIEFLREAMPGIARVADALNPGSPLSGAELERVRVVARSSGILVQEFAARSFGDFEGIFEQMAQARVDAVETGEDGLVLASLDAVASLAARWRLPAIGPAALARAGGLMGYGVDFAEAFRHAAVFVDRILHGAKPSEMPIEQATRFQMVLNLKTAQALGIQFHALLPRPRRRGDRMSVRLAGASGAAASRCRCSMLRHALPGGGTPSLRTFRCVSLRTRPADPVPQSS